MTPQQFENLLQRQADSMGLPFRGPQDQLAFTIEPGEDATMQTLYQSRMELWRLRWQHQQPTQTVEVSSPQQVPAAASRVQAAMNRFTQRWFDTLNYWLVPDEASPLTRSAYGWGPHALAQPQVARSRLRDGIIKFRWVMGVPPERFGMVVVGTPADIRRASRQASGGLLSRIFGWFR